MIDIAVMVGLFVAVPIVLFLLPVIPQWILLIYCIAVSFICIVVVKVVFRKIVLKHSETIMAAQSTRTQIKDNNKRIKKIEKNIRKIRMKICMGLNHLILRLKHCMMT